MGKGFLDRPLYQADIQVVLSLNLKLFIYQVLVSMHAKPNKPSWNNTPNAACKTFAWAHGFLFLQPRLWKTASSLLLSFESRQMANIVNRENARGTMAQPERRFSIPVFVSLTQSLLLFTVHVHKSLRIEGRPLTVQLWPSQTFLLFRLKQTLLSISFAPRFKRFHIHVSGIFFFLLLENDTYVDCAGTVENTCVKVAVKNLEKGKNVLQIFLSYINCYDKETKTCPFPIARNINVVIQAFKKHIYARHGLLAKMLKKIIPGRGAVGPKLSV